MKMIKFKKDINGFAALRKRLGLSQQKLADHLNVSRALVSMVEKGERSFSIDALVKLSELEISMKLKQQAEEPRAYLENYHSITIQNIASHKNQNT